MPDDSEGGRRRLGEVIARDRRRLTRFVQSRLARDTGDVADDIVSDVVLRLFERADLLAQVEDLTAYLYRALAHAVTDFFRRRRTSPIAPGSGDGAEDEETAAADPSPDPEAAFAGREQRERIGRALARLSPPERAVWVAVEIEGYTFRELAEDWNEPIGTLLSRKNRAEKRLRAWLAEE